LVKREVSDLDETQRNRSNGGRVVLMEMDVVSKDAIELALC